MKRSEKYNKIIVIPLFTLAIFLYLSGGFIILSGGEKHTIFGIWISPGGLGALASIALFTAHRLKGKQE